MMKEIPYIRVGTSYYKKVQAPTIAGHYNEILASWSIETIRQDHGKSYLSKIPKYDGFTCMPNHIDFKQEYKGFYRELYPTSQDPLFWIHLNIDYPFNLTGILYFPKLTNNLEIQKNKIQLYSNQMYVTDEVKEIVPEFLTLLHGVIDSPDIPLNVSRSYLQSDRNVKKITSYITRKVADKLNDLFKNDRESYEAKWKDIGTFIKYGMITEEKFAEKAKEIIAGLDIKVEEAKAREAEEQASKEKANKASEMSYVKDDMSKHNFIILVKASGKELSEIKSAISDFNRKNFKTDGLKMSAVIYSKGVQMITIKTFSNSKKAMSYQTVFENSTDLETIVSENKDYFIVNYTNYALFFKAKDHDNYKIWSGVNYSD